MTFKAIIKIKTHRAKSPRDIDQISNSLHEYIARAFEEDQAILDSHNVVTGCECKTCHPDNQGHVNEQLRTLEKTVRARDHEIARMRQAFAAIKEEMLPQASNTKMMQFARPARNVINWCKQWA